jgi:hypothetical protein
MGCPVLAAQSWLSFPDCSVLTVLSWQSCPGSPFLVVLSWLSCPGSSFLHNYPFLIVVSLQSGPDSLVHICCPFLTVLFFLSFLTCLSDRPFLVGVAPVEHFHTQKIVCGQDTGQINSIFVYKFLEVWQFPLQTLRNANGRRRSIMIQLSPI